MSQTHNYFAKAGDGSPSRRAALAEPTPILCFAAFFRFMIFRSFARRSYPFQGFVTVFFVRRGFSVPRLMRLMRVCTNAQKIDEPYELNILVIASVLAV
ncbi:MULTISPECIES: hypothetical protein [Rhizobium]|uniref:Uncharacterized protein n=1 Tax=Rhizobium straminoryzae TaxID=1387186 RepID=A0A549TBC3_9HYPH|nr:MULTISPECIES: hypothetical protein [Rhizobium]TRL39177.1 hypothetical protein FNA46_10465 [Rhizobium straminoryzae]